MFFSPLRIRTPPPKKNSYVLVLYTSSACFCLQPPQPRRKSDVSDLLLGTFKLRTDKTVANYDFHQVFSWKIYITHYITILNIAVWILWVVAYSKSQCIVGGVA